MTTTEANKALVRDHIRTMLVEKKWEQAIDRYVDENIVQHSPYLRDGSQAVKEAVGKIIEENPDASYEIKQMFAEDDLVAMFGHFRLSAEDRGMAAFDMFRVRDGKLVEHWDILQPIAEEAENENSMF